MQSRQVHGSCTVVGLGGASTDAPGGCSRTVGRVSSVHSAGLAVRTVSGDRGVKTVVGAGGRSRDSPCGGACTNSGVRGLHKVYEVHGVPTFHVVHRVNTDCGHGGVQRVGGEHGVSTAVGNAEESEINLFIYLFIFKFSTKQFFRKAMQRGHWLASMKYCMLASQREITWTAEWQDHM